MHMHLIRALCALVAVLSISRFSLATPAPAPQQLPVTVAADQGRTAAAPVQANAPANARAATSAEREKYAAREAASPDAKKYKGGDDVVIIGAGTTALILGIVLL